MVAAAQPAVPPGQGDLTAPSGTQPVTPPANAPTPVPQPEPGTSGPETPAVAPAQQPTLDLTPEDILMLANEPSESDGAPFEVGAINLVYDRDGPENPAIAELMNVPFEVLMLAEGMVAPRPGVPTVRLTLAELASQPPRTMYASAITSVGQALVRYMNREKGLLGPLLVPDELDLVSGLDDREPGSTAITLRIFTARVVESRTIAQGDRVPTETRINNAVHSRILRTSPVQPGGAAGGGLIRRDLLDEYVLRLNRHPGRRVDVAVAPAENSGEAVLDFLVSESKPWSIYFQVSNTGTEQTSEWRERIGFVHNQLTGNDDIFSIDFITAALDSANALNANYDARFFGVEGLRWNVNAGWNEYTASDVGLSGEEFTGDGYSVGAGLSWLMYQDRELFVDLIGGFRYESFNVESTFSTGGEEQLWFPYIGVMADRTTETDAWSAMVRMEFQPGGGDEDEMEGLGRSNVDDSWAVLQAEANVSFYLDPLFYGDGWARVNADPTTDTDSTLAHELAFSIRGQTSFGARLIPQVQQVAGGLYTVRGYDESIVAGDDAIIFTAEYRFHLPRSFPVELEPRGTVFGQPFKVAPQQPFGRPDWDLIFRGFVDAGRVIVNDAELFEEDETLIGAGVGLELQFLRNISGRVDLGFALQDVEDGSGEVQGEAGDARLHVLFTVLF